MNNYFLHVGILLTVISYFLGIVFFLRSIKFAGAKLTDSAYKLHVLGLLFHTGVMLLTVFTSLSLNFETSSLFQGGNYLFILSWILSLFFLAFKDRIKYPLVGLIVLTFLLFLLLFSSYFVHFASPSQVNTPNPFLLSLHILPAIVSEACLVTAFLISVIYLLKDYRIKKKSANELFSNSLPSLQSLELVHKQALVLGFLTMTVAVVSGILYFKRFWLFETQFFTDYKQFSAVSIWFTLGILLYLRYKLRLSAKSLNKATVYLVLLFFIPFLILLYYQNAQIHYQYKSSKFQVGVFLTETSNKGGIPKGGRDVRI